MCLYFRDFIRIRIQRHSPYNAPFYINVVDFFKSMIIYLMNVYVACVNHMHPKDAEIRAHTSHSYFISFLRLFRISAVYRFISEIVPRLLRPGPIIKY